MKIFQNPVVVGVLAILAVAVVAHALWPNLKFKHAAAPKAPPAATIAPAQTTAPPRRVPVAVPAAPASDKLDQFLLETNWPRWAGAPRRDPFHGANASNAQSGTEQPKPASAWLTLNSVLLQTGDAVAVINRQVVGDGDTIDGFRIEKIEAQQVWVSGPHGLEAVGFKPEAPPAQRRR